MTEDIIFPEKGVKAYRSSFLDFLDDPFYSPEADCVRFIQDGLLVLDNGKIREIGDYEQLKDRYLDIPIVSYPGMLIMPGFIDTHIHYPQTEMIAAYGEQLLEWLT